MLYELREYRIKEGCLKQWVEVMETLVIPFQERMGMEVLGSFTAVDEPDLYIWIRRFTNESERKWLYDRIYGSRYWEEVVRPAMGDMLLRDEKREILMRSTNTSRLK